jgi:hypothetical protein
VYDVPSDSEEEEIEKIPDEKKVETEDDSDEDSLYGDTTYKEKDFLYTAHEEDEDEEYYWYDTETGKESLLYELTDQIEAATAFCTSEQGLRYYRKKNSVMMKYVKITWSNHDEKTYHVLRVKVKPHSNETKMEIISPGIWMLIDRCHLSKFVWDFEEGWFFPRDKLVSRLLERYSPIDLNIRQAVAMATHPRLGEKSWLGVIDSGVLEMIALLV